ncbi:MAG TPA: hypothetical protein VF423_02270 [Actinomycetes bacterium]
MHEIAVDPPAVVGQSVALRQAASRLSSLCLSGQPAACGDPLAAAAVSGLLSDVTQLTDAVTAELEAVAQALTTAARVYAAVEQTAAGRRPGGRR